MEKIRVIEEKCIGCGACVATCPEVFDFDDEGYAKAINDNINSLDAEIKENAIDAKEGCPTDAIEIEENN